MVEAVWKVGYKISNSKQIIENKNKPQNNDNRTKNVHVEMFLEGSNAKNYAHVTDVPYSSTYHVPLKHVHSHLFKVFLRKNDWNQSSTNEQNIICQLF
jgi:hypothetical protein